MNSACTNLACAIAVFIAAAASFASAAAAEIKAAAMQLRSSAFESGAVIPRKYTCDGDNVSPPLHWTGVPTGTKSLALIADDPDAPGGTWSHWVIYDLPPSVAALGENTPKTESVANGAKQGVNDFQQVGYGGPCPPAGAAHRYFFRLYALDELVQAPAKDKPAAIAGSHRRPYHRRGRADRTLSATAMNRAPRNYFTSIISDPPRSGWARSISGP